MRFTFIPFFFKPIVVSIYLKPCKSPPVHQQPHDPTLVAYLKVRAPQSNHAKQPFPLMKPPSHQCHNMTATSITNKLQESHPSPSIQ